jgi:hypothetical protein
VPGDLVSMEMVIVNEAADTRWSNHANSWTVKKDARKEPRSLTNVGSITKFDQHAADREVRPTNCYDEVRPTRG